jgi:hypothetical protein
VSFANPSTGSGQALGTRFSSSLNPYVVEFDRWIPLPLLFP